MYEEEKIINNEIPNRKSYNGPLTKRVLNRLIKSNKVARALQEDGQIKHGYYELASSYYDLQNRFVVSNYLGDLKSSYGSVIIEENPQSVNLIFIFDRNMKHIIEDLTKKEVLGKRLSMAHYITENLLECQC